MNENKYSSFNKLPVFNLVFCIEPKGRLWNYFKYAFLVAVSLLNVLLQRRQEDSNAKIPVKVFKELVLFESSLVMPRG